jgi:hypothetical protein
VCMSLCTYVAMCVCTYAVRSTVHPLGAFRPARVAVL